MFIVVQVEQDGVGVGLESVDCLPIGLPLQLHGDHPLAGIEQRYPLSHPRQNTLLLQQLFELARNAILRDTNFLLEAFIRFNLKMEILRDLGRDFYTHMLKMSMAFHTERPVGERAENRIELIGRQDWQSDGLVGQSAGRTSADTLAAGDASALSHRLIQVERNPSRMAFARSSDDLVRLQVVTSTDAAVAEDAGLVINRNDG